MPEKVIQFILERLETFTCGGLTIDLKCTFINHLQQLTVSSLKLLRSILTNCRYSWKSNTAKHLFKACIRSKFEYLFDIQITHAIKLGKNKFKRDYSNILFLRRMAFIHLEVWIIAHCSITNFSFIPNLWDMSSISQFVYVI